VNGVYSHTAHVASFVGFVPSENPALAGDRRARRAAGQVLRGDIAAPTFARVVGPALNYLRVPPTEAIVPAPAHSGRAAREGRAPGAPARAHREGRARPRARGGGIGRAGGASPRPSPRPGRRPWRRAGLVPDLYGSICATRSRRWRARASAPARRAPASSSPKSRGGQSLSPGQICTLVLAPEAPEGEDEGQGM
jgi:hypothetical protein